ncbi:hypothetical protein H0H92_011937 [Tricholoma furcatifolium]|nr:hypothetical protein H0H92_011937 [Tricholoma furcatifolium]
MEELEEPEWMMMAVINLASIFEYGRPGSVLGRIGGKDSDAVSPAAMVVITKPVAVEEEKMQEKMDVDSSPWISSTRAGAPNQSSPQATEMPAAEAAEREYPPSFKYALQLVFSMLSHVLEYPTRAITFSRCSKPSVISTQEEARILLTQGKLKHRRTLSKYKKSIHHLRQAIRAAREARAELHAAELGLGSIRTNIRTCGFGVVIRPSSRVDHSLDDCGDCTQVLADFGDIKLQAIKSTKRKAPEEGQANIAASTINSKRSKSHSTKTSVAETSAPQDSTQPVPRPKRANQGQGGHIARLEDVAKQIRPDLHRPGPPPATSGIASDEGVNDMAPQANKPRGRPRENEKRPIQPDPPLSAAPQPRIASSRGYPSSRLPPTNAEEENPNLDDEDREEIAADPEADQDDDDDEDHLVEDDRDPYVEEEDDGDDDDDFQFNESQLMEEGEQVLKDNAGIQSPPLDEQSPDEDERQALLALRKITFLYDPSRSKPLQKEPVQDNRTTSPQSYNVLSAHHSRRGRIHPPKPAALQKQSVIQGSSISIYSFVSSKFSKATGRSGLSQAYNSDDDDNNNENDKDNDRDSNSDNDDNDNNNDDNNNNDDDDNNDNDDNLETFSTTKKSKKSVTLSSYPASWKTILEQAQNRFCLYAYTENHWPSAGTCFNAAREFLTDEVAAYKATPQLSGPVNEALYNRDEMPSIVMNCLDEWSTGSHQNVKFEGKPHYATAAIGFSDLVEDLKKNSHHSRSFQNLLRTIAERGRYLYGQENAVEALDLGIVLD